MCVWEGGGGGGNWGRTEVQGKERNNNSHKSLTETIC